MGYFAVSYQLNDEKDYPKLWAEMKRLGAHRVMRSFWYLDINVNFTSEVRDHLSDFVDEDDYIAVVAIESKPSHKRCFKGTKKWTDDRF
jgi:CRISPR/Cas system-associated endoribonuclease Cas2